MLLFLVLHGFFYRAKFDVPIDGPIEFKINCSPLRQASHYSTFIFNLKAFRSPKGIEVPHKRLPGGPLKAGGFEIAHDC